MNGSEPLRKPDVTTRPNPAWDSRGAIIAVALMAASIFAVIQAIDEPVVSTVDPASNPTPYAFAWSNVLYVTPIGVGMWALQRSPSFAALRKPFWLTAGLLTVPVVVLDLLVIAPTFFTFPNPGASVFTFPGYDLLDRSWGGDEIPIEDPLFYVFAMMMVLVLYVWCRGRWVTAYDPDLDGDHVGPCRHGHLFALGFQLRYLAWAVAIVLALWAAQRLLYPRPGARFPWYAAWLTFTALIPVGALWDSISGHVNWRAASITMLYSILISTLYEVTFALPYGWWGFQDEVLIGLCIKPWWNVPIEQVFLYFVNTFLIVLVFEATVVGLAARRDRKAAEAGESESDAPAVPSGDAAPV